MEKVSKNQLQSLFTTGLAIGLGRNEPRYEALAWRKYSSGIFQGESPWPTPTRVQNDGKIFGETLHELEVILQKEAARSNKNPKRRR